MKLFSSQQPRPRLNKIPRNTKTTKTAPDPNKMTAAMATTAREIGNAGAETAAATGAETGMPMEMKK